jgi:hypothetical protein
VQDAEYIRQVCAYLTLIGSTGKCWYFSLTHDVTAHALLCRTRSIFGKLGIPDFDRVHVQVLGAEESYGKHAIPLNKCPREVRGALIVNSLKIAT